MTYCRIHGRDGCVVLTRHCPPPQTRPTMWQAIRAMLTGKPWYPPLRRER